MPSTFFGIELGTRALNANQIALDVAGQNTANINTPGYSRQVVNLEGTDPGSSSAGAIGTGVIAASITRVRDAYTDKRLYVANAQQGATNNLRDILGQVENAYGEPSTTGVGQQLTDFLNSFSDLSANAESSATRATVLNKAESLVSAVHSVDSALGQLPLSIKAQISAKITDVNNLATQIADLNKQIRLSVASGDHPNDLQDKRGALLNQLSSLVDVQTVDTKNQATGQPTGEIQLNVGGSPLVQGDTATALPATVTTANGNLGLTTASGDTISLHGGEIYGLIKASTLVAGYRSDLDTLATGIITAVNTQHQAGLGLDGVSGRPFFTGTNAATFAVSTVIEGNLNAIAAATPPAAGQPVAQGNGDNATAIAGLTSASVISGFSLNAYYNARVAGIGADSSAYQTEAANQQQIVTQLNNQQASVSGVSINEELTRLLQYQRSYQASARLINVFDDTLDRIINGLGAGK